jgi:hypothetical protein
MSHIPDLEVDSLSGHVAVGWLHPDHEFPRAAVPEEFLVRIKAFAERWGDSIDALGWGAAGGVHTWEFWGRAWASGILGQVRAVAQQRLAAFASRAGPSLGWWPGPPAAPTIAPGSQEPWRKESP